MSPLAPPDGGRALFWACALACLIGLAATLGARAFAAAAFSAAERASGRITLQVLSPADPGAVARAEEALRALPGVIAADAMTPERAAALAARWGGEIAAEDLVALRLIEAELDPQSGLTPEMVTMRLGEVGFEVEAAAAGEAAQEDRAAAAASARTADIAGWALALSATAIIWLMARARAAARAEAITLLADLGATRAQATGAYGGEAAFSGFAAGTLGAALAAGAAWGLAPLAAPGFEARALFSGPEDLAPFAATPLIAALAAAAGARSAAGKAFDRAVRR